MSVLPKQQIASYSHGAVLDTPKGKGQDTRVFYPNSNPGGSPWYRECMCSDQRYKGYGMVSEKLREKAAGLNLVSDNPVSFTVNTFGGTPSL